MRAGGAKAVVDNPAPTDNLAFSFMLYMLKAFITKRFAFFLRSHKRAKHRAS